MIVGKRRLNYFACITENKPFERFSPQGSFFISCPEFGRRLCTTMSSLTCSPSRKEDLGDVSSDDDDLDSMNPEEMKAEIVELRKQLKSQSRTKALTMHNSYILNRFSRSNGETHLEDCRRYLGEGGNASVFKTTGLFSARPVAMKELPVQSDDKDSFSVIIKTRLSEAFIQEPLGPHKNIVSLLNVFVVSDTPVEFDEPQDEDSKSNGDIAVPLDLPQQGSWTKSDLKKHNGYVLLSLEYCNKGKLTTYIEELIHQESDPTTRLAQNLHIFLQIVDGCSWLHKHDIIHADLKADNVFLHENGVGDIVAKIGDFGEARTLYDDENPKKTGYCYGGKAADVSNCSGR